MAITRDQRDSVTYKFPKSEEIIISRADLQIQLQEFKKAIIASFSIYDLLAIISFWAPVFAGVFVPMFSLSAGELRTGYIVFAAVVTLIIFYNKILRKFYPGSDDEIVVSNDPKKMSQMILDQCQPKKDK